VIGLATATGLAMILGTIRRPVAGLLTKQMTGD
jgi:hypothetical protein